MTELAYISGVTTIGLDPSKCNGCRMCLKVCPHPVVGPLKGAVEILEPDPLRSHRGVYFSGTDPELIVIDRETGAGQLVATLSTARMSGMAANFRWSPTQEEIDIISFSGGDAGNQCADTPGQWTDCQHKRPPEHAPGVDGDETFAWDAILDSNGDAGEPVYAVVIPVPPIFADGFESGDTSAWSSTVP